MFPWSIILSSSFVAIFFLLIMITIIALVWSLSIKYCSLLGRRYQWWVCNHKEYAILCKIFWKKKIIKKSSQLRQNQKTLMSVFGYFLSGSTKNLFLLEKLTWIFDKWLFWDFPVSLCNSYVKFLMIDIKFRFTCVEWNMY